MMERRGRSTFAAVALAFVLVGSGAAYAFNRAEPVQVTVRWHEGQTLRYRATLGLRGHAGAVGGTTSSFDVRVVETLTWRVRTVDTAGTATIEVTASDVQVLGGPAPGARPGRVTGALTVDARGRVLAATDAWLLTGGPGVATYVPGLAQLLPLLPSGPVNSGATWSSTVAPTVTAFAPAPSERLTGRFDGALLRTVTVTRVDGTLDVGAALAAAGRSTTLAVGAHPSIGYAGTTRTEQAAWIDRDAAAVPRTLTTGTFDLRIESRGYPLLFPTFQTGPPAGQASAPFGGLIGAGAVAAPTAAARMWGSLSLELDLLP